MRAIAPVYGGINLEDISAPRCFEIEARLRELLDIPVFHDDQHGTAIVVLAALTNALRVVGKRLQDVSDRRLRRRRRGARDHPAAARPGRRRRSSAATAHGAVHAGQPSSDEFRAWIADPHQPPAARRARSRRCWPARTCSSASPRPNLLTGEDIATMAPGAIVFALANPDPEVDPVAASEHAAVVATGRSDYPNQINNVLAFPGFFRGLLDAGASDITDAMMIAAATAIADVVEADELNPTYIVPSVFDPAVAPAVAAAVRRGGRARAGPAPRPPRPARPPTRGRRVSALADELDARLAHADAAPGEGLPGRARRRASRCTRSTCPPTATPPTRSQRWRLEATAVLDRHAPTAAGAPGGVRHRRRAGRGGARPGARQARARAGRGPADRLRGRLRRPRRRRGGPGGGHGGDGAAPYASTAGQAAPFGGIRFKSFEAPTRRRGRAHAGAVRRRRSRDGGRLPDGFVVTLPKVTSVDQVEAMVLVLRAAGAGARRWRPARCGSRSRWRPRRRCSGRTARRWSRG